MNRKDIPPQFWYDLGKLMAQLDRTDLFKYFEEQGVNMKTLVSGLFEIAQVAYREDDL